MSPSDARKAIKQALTADIDEATQNKLTKVRAEFRKLVTRIRVGIAVYYVVGFLLFLASLWLGTTQHMLQALMVLITAFSFVVVASWALTLLAQRENVEMRIIMSLCKVAEYLRDSSVDWHRPVAISNVNVELSTLAIALTELPRYLGTTRFEVVERAGVAAGSVLDWQIISSMQTDEKWRDDLSGKAETALKQFLEGKWHEIASDSSPYIPSGISAKRKLVWYSLAFLDVGGVVAFLIFANSLPASVTALITTVSLSLLLVCLIQAGLDIQKIKDIHGMAKGVASGE